MSDNGHTMTLEDWVKHPYKFACRKHGLADDADLYACEQIDRMTNSEFLSALSDALEELLGKGV